MIRYARFLGMALASCWAISCSNQPNNDHTQQPQLFTLLNPEQTGVSFQNALTEGLNTNILMYEYFYNGGGVAAGDFNGDGWIDLYFTSNMAANQFYLNQGVKGGAGVHFQDITDASGAGGRPGPWKTGVTTVDINNDGKLDIYLCYSGAMPSEKRANQLFVNQGNDANGVPVFAEKAAEYGLAHQGFSNQAYFLDYDRDGDLDMLLLNHNPKNLPILNESSTAELFRTDDPDKGLRLFKQTNGHFDDVTLRAGINGSPLSYGLGLGISDFNNDGWPDFYVSNDYAVPDYLYINNQNGTFTNQIAQRVGHTSQFSMGNDVADINNDGQQDIVTLDMLPEDNRRQKLLLAPDNFAKFDLNVRSGFYYQYMRNMLQLNNGNGSFSEVGQVAGISNTDWSWAALLADFDNDGWKDLFVSNGYFRDYTNLDFIKYMDDFVKERGRLMRQDVLEIINHMPASNVVNYVFRNQDGHTFSNQTTNWGLNTPSNSNGAAYADLDNDGDLDLAVNNINQPAFIFQNQSQQLNKNNYLKIKLNGGSTNSQGIGATVTIFAGGRQQRLFQNPSRGYLSAVSSVLQVGLGKATKVDSVQVVWASQKQQLLRSVQVNQVLTLDEKNASDTPLKLPKSKPLFVEVPTPVAHQDNDQAGNDFDRQLLLTTQLSHQSPCMVKGDVNQDGLEDVLIGGPAGQATALYVQRKGGSFALQKNPVFEADKAYHDAAAALFDANGDSFVDIYIASGGYNQLAENDALLQDRLYLNDGKGNFSKTAGLPSVLGSKSCVAVGDANQDGHPDLFVGGRVIPGNYPEIPTSYLLINDGKGHFSNQTQQLAPNLEKIGMVTDAVWVDLNQDKKNELIVVGEWMPVSVFAFENNKLQNKTEQFFKQSYKGWWNKIAIGDFNHDQKPDLMVGNWGTNSQVKASSSEPAELYYKDFDNNGTLESILCFYIQGKSYPYVTRDELLNQINGYRGRFPTYESYSDATLKDIFEADALQKAGHLEANHLQTTCFLSSSAGTYTEVVLPIQAQYAPVHAIAIADFDQDGHQDALLCGNDSYPKIRLGKMDANYGVLLKGNGKGNFTYLNQTTSGLQLRGDVRSVISINDFLLFGINKQKIAAYHLNH
ncbi:MAG: VCBS repeat-containing protein [Spirosomataceae bacterium]